MSFWINPIHYRKHFQNKLRLNHWIVLQSLIGMRFRRPGTEAQSFWTIGRNSVRFGGVVQQYFMSIAFAVRRVAEAQESSDCRSSGQSSVFHPNGRSGSNQMDRSDYHPKNTSIAHTNRTETCCHEERDQRIHWESHPIRSSQWDLSADCRWRDQRWRCGHSYGRRLRTSVGFHGSVGDRTPQRSGYLPKTLFRRSYRLILLIVQEWKNISKSTLKAWKACAATSVRCLHSGKGGLR